MKMEYSKDETESYISQVKTSLKRFEAAESLTPEQEDIRIKLLDHLGELEEHRRKFEPQPVLTLQDFGSTARSRGGELLGPSDKKDYRSLFGSSRGYSWPDNDSNFFQAALSGRFHPGLIRNSMTEATPSDGGFLVPTETAARIHAVSLENEVVMPLCLVQPMTTNQTNVPAMAIGSHASHVFGGFIASYTAEAGTINENSPKVRNMELLAKKLTGMIRFSSELNLDSPNGMAQIESICGKGLAWYRDRAFLKGSGAGEPLGILNSDCLVTVAKEAGQNADTIMYENLVNMVSRLYAGSFSNSVWICHQTTIPQLLQLSVAIGTGGSHIPVLNESNGQFSMLTRPVVFTEKTEKLGDLGDIMLCDFSQYIVGLRNEMRFDTSIHVHFGTDELVSRLIERHDGQPLWDEPLTLEDGSTTVSPFVTLAARA